MERVSLRGLLQNPQDAHDIDCLRRAFDAGARVDLKASLARELAGLVTLETLHRFALHDLIDHGDSAPACPTRVGVPTSHTAGCWEGFHHVATTWFTSDLPIPEVVVREEAPTDRTGVGRISDLRAQRSRRGSRPRWWCSSVAHRKFAP